MYINNQKINMVQTKNTSYVKDILKNDKDGNKNKIQEKIK